MYFEHERTGAKLMYIANNDTNRVFDLTFFTRAIDNTGLPHVFEHSTLDGSEKYPSKALFFNLSYQTYNTYMNAFTMPLLTSYPVASLSEEQLLKYADYYTDSCLHPMLMTDESIFNEEAWRYRLGSVDDDLTIEGTVYSEMQGAIGLSTAAYYNMLRTAFPGSTIGNESGGEPEHIPEMSWEDVRNYHDEYYHPSNCVAYLYGQFEDYTAFLKLLNEAFEPYEKREFTFEDAGYEALTESVKAENAFPLTADADTTNGTAIYYAILCPGLNEDPEAELLMNTLTDVLVSDGSSLMQTLKTELPSGRFATYIELDGPVDMIVFYAENVERSDADRFKSTVDKVLADVAENGFPEDLIDSVASSLAMSTRLVGEGDSVGVSLIESVASYQASTGDPFGYMDYVDALEKIREWSESGAYAEAVAKWLTSDPLTVLSVTYPEAGLREKLDEAETQRLAEVKAGMSADELKAIVAATNAEDEDDDASEYVKALQAVTVSSLPEEIRSYTIDDTTKDGVRYVNAHADVDGVGQTALFIDASGLPQESVLWFKLYTDVLGELPTGSHSREELSVLTTRYLYDGEIRLSLLDTYGTKEYRPNLRLGWKAADEDLAAGYDLMYEILFETDYSDIETLQGLVSQKKASLKSSINSAPYNFMLYRAMGSYVPLYRYYSYFNGIEYYSFLEQTEALLQTDPDAAIRELQSVRDYFFNSTNAICVYAGSEDGIKANAPLAEEFFAKLDKKDITPVTYEFPAVAPSEALIVDGTVQFNGLVADYETLGMEGYTGDLDALSSLLSDAYLYPQLRDQYGAYGVFTGFMTDGGLYVVSYRDPNIVETFEVYDGIADFLRTLETDSEELDGYILSAYSYYAMPEGELSGALSAALSTLTGEPLDIKLQYMRELKTLTAEKIAVYADAYEKLASDGTVFTAGGAGAINANADLYDDIFNPFGAVDASAIEFDDVPEDNPYYEAVRFVFENGIMPALDETVFGVDEGVTVGDMAYAMYVFCFDEVPEDDVVMREDLAYYNIMSTLGANDEPLTGKDGQTALAGVAMAFGVKPNRDPSATTDQMTRGEMALAIMNFYDYLVEQFS